MIENEKIILASVAQGDEDRFKEIFDYYYPKDSSDKSMYRIAINQSCVRMKHANGECLFVDYPLWKQLK